MSQKILETARQLTAKAVAYVGDGNGGNSTLEVDPGNLDYYPATKLLNVGGQAASIATATTPASGTCAIQLTFKDASGTALAAICAGTAYVSTSATGVSSNAGTSVATLTNGEVLTVVTGRLFHFITSAVGLLGITLTAGAGTYYICVRMPNGKVAISDACVVNA